MNYFNLHTHTWSQSPDVVELVNRYPHETGPLPPHFSIGIHPWYIDHKRMEEQLAVIDVTAAHPSCLAIGECGLDSKIETPVASQEPVFRRQIEIAMRHGKPLVLHLVGAYDDLIRIKRELDPQIPIVIHGFSKSPELARQLQGEGLYLSFGKYLLRNPGLCETFKSVSPERIFLETDTAEETIEQVYDKAAQYLGGRVQEVKKIIAQNFNTVFGQSLS